MEPGACHLPERREPATGTWQCGNPCHLSLGTQSTRAANHTHLQDRGCPTPDLSPLSPQLLHHHNNAPWVARRVGHRWMGTKIHPKFHLSSQTLTWGCNPPEEESFLRFACRLPVDLWWPATHLPGLAPGMRRMQQAGQLCSKEPVELLLPCSSAASRWTPVEPPICPHPISFPLSIAHNYCPSFRGPDRPSSWLQGKRKIWGSLCPLGPHHFTSS